jgi:hypothetical protein
MRKGGEKMLVCNCGAVVKDKYQDLYLEVFAAGCDNAQTRAGCKHCARRGQWVNGQGYLSSESAYSWYFDRHTSIK